MLAQWAHANIHKGKTHIHINLSQKKKKPQLGGSDANLYLHYLGGKNRPIS